MQLELPSPEYPGLQVQLWDPSVLLQTALMSQLWVLIIHSSTSMKESSNVRKMYLITARSIRVIPKITSVTEENNFVLNDCLSTAKSNLTITLTTTKQRKESRFYQCNYFHLQSIQAYRYNYEIPWYYYRQHWCDSYGCLLHTHQYLWKKAPNVRKVYLTNSFTGL